MRSIGLVFLLVASCSAREPSIKTNPEPLAPSPVAAATGSSGPSVSPSAPASVEAEPPSDEPLIREYETLARKPATKIELETFVKTHPKLLTATARPYDETIMWMLQYELEDAALVLYEAGANTPKETLGLAAGGGLDGFVSALLAKGVSPNEAGESGVAPLHQAAKYGKLSTVRKLLAAKANVNARTSNEGWTSLHIAVMEREEEVVSALIAAHADLEAEDDHRRTPLHWGPFAYSRQPKHIYRKIGEPHDTVFVDPGPAIGMKLLLDAGAKINAVDDEGNTALHEAALIGSVRGAEILIARGANVNIKNKEGETPTSIARASEHRRGVLELLTHKL